jgi:hypothetical protein
MHGNCPHCHQGDLRQEYEDMVCWVCGYRKPFVGYSQDRFRQRVIAEFSIKSAISNRKVKPSRYELGFKVRNLH